MFDFSRAIRSISAMELPDYSEGLTDHLDKMKAGPLSDPVDSSSLNLGIMSLLTTAMAVSFWVTKVPTNLEKVSTNTNR